MTRPLRIENADGNFHVRNRGANRGDIAFDDPDRHHFFDLLPKIIRRFGRIIREPTLMTIIFISPSTPRANPLARH